MNDDVFEGSPGSLGKFEVQPDEAAPRAPRAPFRSPHPARQEGPATSVRNDHVAMSSGTTSRSRSRYHRSRTGARKDLGFAAHLYGPYPADVQEAIGGSGPGSTRSRPRLNRGRLDPNRARRRRLRTRSARLVSRMQPCSLTSMEIEGNRVEPEAAGQLAKTLGWKLTPEDILRASPFLGAIDRG